MKQRLLDFLVPAMDAGLCPFLHESAFVGEVEKASVHTSCSQAHALAATEFPVLPTSSCIVYTSVAQANEEWLLYLPLAVLADVPTPTCLVPTHTLLRVSLSHGVLTFTKTFWVTDLTGYEARELTLNGTYAPEFFYTTDLDATPFGYVGAIQALPQTLQYLAPSYA